jgi:exodeoxyribonuclease VIII
MIQVMLDLETLSTRSNATILSIGAVKFTEEDGIVDKFYRTVDPRTCKAVGLHVCPDTVEWWSKQSKLARDALMKDNISISQALDEFAEWYGTKKIPVWGNGAGFDNVIMENAYMACNTKRPWTSWYDRCFRTVKNLINIEPDAREGTHHNALDDAVYQTQHLLKILGSK